MVLQEENLKSVW